MILNPYRFGPSFVTSASASLATDGAVDLNGYNVRIVIAASALSVSGTIVKVRFTPRSSGGSNLVVNAAYIGEKAAAGDAYDFAAAPTQLLFSGSGGFTATPGTSVSSDELTFTLDETKNYIISYSMNAASNVRFGAASGWDTYFKAAAAADVNTANVTGYTADAGVSYAVDLIQVA